MLDVTEQDRSNFLQISHEIGKDLIRHPEALRAPRLGVSRMQENIDACIVELKMTADCEGCEAASAYRPQTDQGQEQPVAILDFALLVTVDWQCKRRVHELDAEVERLPRGDETIESILGQRPRSQVCFDRF
jgi:hypothetical protein